MTLNMFPSGLLLLFKLIPITINLLYYNIVEKGEKHNTFMLWTLYQECHADLVYNILLARIGYCGLLQRHEQRGTYEL